MIFENVLLVEKSGYKKQQLFLHADYWNTIQVRRVNECLKCECKPVADSIVSGTLDENTRKRII